MLKVKKQFAAGIVVGLLASGVAVAVASIPNSSTSVISGCYSTKNGALRVIDYQAGRRCATGEVLLEWNQRGAQGIQGIQGPPGPTGPSSGRSVEMLGAPLSPTLTRTIPDVPAGTYLILLEAFVLGGSADCWADINPHNAVFSGGKLLGRYDNGSYGGISRAFRIMRLDSTGSIILFCEKAGSFPGTSIDGIFSIVPLS